MDVEEIPGFRAALLGWFAGHGRDLPFRDTRDPYAVWVSEIMLQQTTVAAVAPYWKRFMARYPTVSALAEAPLDEVRHAWAGLGYYARARNLHRAAGEIARRHRGDFPERFEDILALPGIGRYTAGAIASFAFNQDRAVVDANVARVLTRVEAIEGDPKSGPTQRALWASAEALLAIGRARDWNHALFDLGATICVPADPKCPVCPVRPWCRASREGRQGEFPQIPPRPPMTEQTDVAAVIRDGAGRVLVVQRPETGVWAGLWELPRGTLAPGEGPEAGLARVVRERLGVEAVVGAEAASLVHGVMRRRITLRAFRAEVSPGALEANEAGPMRWVGPTEAAGLAMASPQRRILRRILGDRPAAESLS